MEIYLIRHGQTTGDIENRYSGEYDDDLTRIGIAQSQQLVVLLATKTINNIFANPLHWARQTSEIIGRGHNIPIQIVENLRERNFYGVLTGLKKLRPCAHTLIN